jgi:hypothetical protein
MYMAKSSIFVSLKCKVKEVDISIMNGFFFFKLFKIQISTINEFSYMAELTSNSYEGRKQF